MLTRMERAVWLRTLAAETRTDMVGAKAQGVLVRTLDGVKATGEPWCACPEHEEAVADVLRYVWRQPPI